MFISQYSVFSVQLHSDADGDTDTVSLPRSEFSARSGSIEVRESTHILDTEELEDILYTGGNLHIGHIGVLDIAVAVVHGEIGSCLDALSVLDIGNGEVIQARRLFGIIAVTEVTCQHVEGHYLAQLRCLMPGMRLKIQPLR